MRSNQLLVQIIDSILVPASFASLWLAQLGHSDAALFFGVAVIMIGSWRFYDEAQARQAVRRERGDNFTDESDRDYWLCGARGDVDRTAG